MCDAAKSTRKTCLSDEPFTIRDIQFDNPQVRVRAVAPRQVLVKIVLIFRVLSARAHPGAVTGRIRHTFEKARIAALFGQNDNNCPGVAFTFVKNGCKAAGGFDRADQARHFKVGGQSGAQAASFSIELASSA